MLGVPVAERFTFCLNTLLSDIAARCENVREDIILAQVDLFAVLTNLLRTHKDQSTRSTPQGSTAKCKLVKILIHAEIKNLL